MEVDCNGLHTGIYVTIPWEHAFDKTLKADDSVQPGQPTSESSV